MASKERQILHRCPHCGEQITRPPEHGGTYTCPRCGVRYGVLANPGTRTAAFVDESSVPTPEPLGLPKGSVRALIALAMAATCAVLVANGHDLPSSLASLVLTIVGFYYGFRTKAGGLSDRIYDPSARREQPLRLPAGAIRGLLVLTFAAVGAVLAYRGRLVGNLDHLELFVILAGLVVGNWFARASRHGSHGSRAFMAHAKGLFGLAVTGVLVFVFATGRHVTLPPWTVMAICAAISFYFGSRS